MASHMAARHTSQSLVTGALTMTVASGLPVWVYGLWLNNTTGNEVDFSINDGAGTLIQTVTVPANNFVELTVPFIADAGIQVVAGTTGVHATVFHSSPGR